MFTDVIEALEIAIDMMHNGHIHSIDECQIYDAYRSACDVRRKYHYCIINRLPIYFDSEFFIQQLSLYNGLLYDLTAKKHILFDRLVPFGWMNRKKVSHEYDSQTFSNNFLIPNTYSDDDDFHHDAYKVDEQQNMTIYTFKLEKISSRDTSRRQFSEKYSMEILNLANMENREKLMIDTRNKLCKIDELLKEFENIMRMNFTIEDIFVKNYEKEYISIRDVTLSASNAAKLTHLKN